MTRLDVWMHGHRVADIDDRTGRLVLTWASDLLDRVEVGRPVLSVRLDAQPSADRPPPALVRSFLGGLLPETSTAARARLARRAATSSDDVLGMLTLSGGDVAGAAVFTPGGVTPGPGQLEELPDDRAVRRHLERSRDDEHLGIGDSSLPGVQPKTALTLLGGRWHLPRGGAASTHILKPQLPERPELVHDESWSSLAAQAVGLRAAVSHVQHFDGFAALVVPRYDRGVTPDTPPSHDVLRFHQEDGAQALGLTSDDIEAKFGWHRPAANLRALAATLLDNGGDHRELLRLCTLNVLLGNTDAHAKNISFVHGDEGRIELAPAYDVSPHAQLGRTRLALSMNGSFDLRDTSTAEIVAEARTWRMPARSASAVVDDVVDRLREWLRSFTTPDPSSEPALQWVTDNLATLR